MDSAIAGLMNDRWLTDYYLIRHNMFTKDHSS